MFVKNTIILFLSLICVSKSTFGDTLTRCSLNDDVCNTNLVHNIIKKISNTGIPEYNIPPLDPLHIKDVSISVLDMLNLTIIDGFVTGLGNCVINKYETGFSKGISTMDLTCDLFVKGRYRAFSSGPLVDSLFGPVHGEGNGKVKIEKLHIVLEFSYGLVNWNGDIYVSGTADKLKYRYEILGKVTFSVDNLYIGETESSKLVTNFLNDNWKNLFASFGGTVMDSAMEHVHSYLKSFYNNVPAKYFISDDLTSFVSN